MRPFNPVLVSRLQLEAEAIETALIETIRRSHERACDEVARWDIGLAPEGWNP